MSEKPTDNLVDRAAAAMRDQPIPAEQIESARARVLARITEGDAPAAATDAAAPLRGCADIRALFARYRAGALAPGRELLVQDHLRECLQCRSAFANRGVSKLLPWRTEAPARRTGSPLPRFAVAAAVLIIGGGLGVIFRGAFMTAPGGSRAELVSADGAVYVVSARGQRPLAVGGAIDEREWVRTPRGSRAVLRLRDDSRVELREHTELGVSMNRHDVTVHLERGSVIVRAAKPDEGHLLVATEDATVAAGTLFSVSRGIKGSRVSVIEGSARVEDRRGEHQLGAGNQLSTNGLIAAVPIRDEIAWSRELDQHLGVLKEISALDEKLETVRWPGLRYGSRLLERLPPDALVVAAIPNYGDALQEAHALFEQHLAESEVLRRWWQSHGPGGDGAEAKLSEAIEKIRAVAQHIGDEIVFALVPTADGHDVRPLILAEVKGGAERAQLGAELARLVGEHGDRIGVYDEASLPTGAGAVAGHGPLVLLTDALVAVGAGPEPLRRVATPPGAGRFTETPFGMRIVDAYRDGAGLLFAVDLEAITAKVAQSGRDAEARERILRGLGARDVKYLVVERQTTGGTVQNRATLSFSGPRVGVASWLAAPAPMGALDFVGSGASFAAAFVVKEPALVLDDLVRLGDSGSQHFREGMQALEGRAGVQLREDLAAPLGNDLAIAIDGPLLPVPSWKLVLEVHDPDLVSQTVERLVAEINRQATAHGHKGLSFEHHPAKMSLNAGVITSHETFVVRALAAPVQACFLFSDGYLVAAPSEELLYRAVRNRQKGDHLRGSGRFRALLPPDRHADFSGLVYHNLGEAGAAVGDWFGGAPLRPEQRDALEALTRAAKPGLVYVYGEPNQIEVASAGGVFGLGLEHFVGSASIHDLLRRRIQASPRP